MSELDFVLGFFPPWKGFLEALVLVLTALLFGVAYCFYRSVRSSQPLAQPTLKNFVEDKACKDLIAKGRGVIRKVQDSMSETERSVRLGARRNTRKKDPIRMGELKNQKLLDKKKRPPNEIRDLGELGNQKLKPGSTTLYPIQKLENLDLKYGSSSGSDTSEQSGDDELSPDKENELKEEAATEGYYPDELPPEDQNVRVRKRQLTVEPTRPVSTAPPPYEGRVGTLSFLSEKVKKKLSLAYPVFEAAEWGRDIMQELGLVLSNKYSVQAQEILKKMGYEERQGLSFS